MLNSLILVLSQLTSVTPSPVRLSCFYIGMSNGKPIHQTIDLDEKQGLAVWTNVQEAVPTSRTLRATFLPNQVDILVYSHPTGDAHYRINRSTLDSEYLVPGIVSMRGSCVVGGQAAERKF